MKLTIALIAVLVCQWSYFKKYTWKQRQVQVIEIGVDHAPRQYVVWENDK
jgi:hypothetical protein